LVGRGSGRPRPSDWAVSTRRKGARHGTGHAKVAELKKKCGRRKQRNAGGKNRGTWVRKNKNAGITREWWGELKSWGEKVREERQKNNFTKSIWWVTENSKAFRGPSQNALSPQPKRAQKRVEGWATVRKGDCLGGKAKVGQILGRREKRKRNPKPKKKQTPTNKRGQTARFGGKVKQASKTICSQSGKKRRGLPLEPEKAGPKRKGELKKKLRRGALD